MGCHGGCAQREGHPQAVTVSSAIGHRPSASTVPPPWLSLESTSVLAIPRRANASISLHGRPMTCGLWQIRHPGS
jgi:hypothetical protein